MEDDYVATILIGGEERFWGEECFWIETWTAPSGGVESAVATLMSYSAFGDTAWLENFQKYARKTVSDVDEDGRPIIQIMKRSGSYKRRGGPRRSITYAIDSLGTDTVTAVKGVIYKCAKVSIRQGIGMNSDVGDSTVRNEVREDRMAYYSDKVPITSLAREDIETSTIRKSWKIGRSADAIQKTVDHGLGISRIVDYGSGGLAPKLVPISARKPLARQGPSHRRRRGARRRAEHRAPRAEASRTAPVRTAPGRTAPNRRSLAHADHADRQLQTIGDREDGATAGGAVELGERQARHRHGAPEVGGLLDAVLAQRGVEHEQHVVRRPVHDAPRHAHDLLQLGHQVALGVEPPGGVDEHDVAPARARRGQRVVRHRRGIGAGARTDDLDARARRPHVELLARGGAERVRRDQRRRAALAREARGELAGERRLADAVDADEERDPRALRSRLEGGAPRARQLHGCALERVAQVERRLDAHQALGPLDHALGGLGADVGLEQRFLQLGARGGIHRAAQPEQGPDLLLDPPRGCA